MRMSVFGCVHYVSSHLLRHHKVKKATDHTNSSKLATTFPKQGPITRTNYTYSLFTKLKQNKIEKLLIK